MRPKDQSATRFPLSWIFGSAASVRALRALASQGQPIGTSLVAKHSGLTWKGALTVLEGLTAAKVVVSYGTKGAQLYQLNPRHPLLASVEALFRDERENWSALLAELRRVFSEHDEIPCAWYYGSVARGEDKPSSDFDVALIVPEDLSVDRIVETIREAVAVFEDRYLLTFSVIGLSDLDVIRLSATEDPWWASMSMDAKSLKGPSPSDYANQLRERGSSDENRGEERS